MATTAVYSHMLTQLYVRFKAGRFSTKTTIPDLRMALSVMINVALLLSTLCFYVV